MEYTHLSQAMSDYCRYVQLILKSGVNIRTGALQKSIKVSCTVNGAYYQLILSANNYWRYLRNPFPIDSIFTTASLSAPSVHTSFPQDSGSRYKFNFPYWQAKLNQAFELDIKQSLNL